MPGTRNQGKAVNPLAGYQQVEVDSLALAVVTARLVEKINRNFKFTFGDCIAKQMSWAGSYIRKGVRTMPGKKKVEYLSRACDELEGMLFPVEATLAAGIITAEEKSAFDVCYDKVSSQTHGLLNSQLAKLQAYSAGRSSAGSAAGENPK